jgi:hypothetical protein
MLDSIPVPFQVVIWPLMGAAVILALTRFLPFWVRRLVALAAAVTTLVSVWSLAPGNGARVEIFWDPVNFFRVSPSLISDSTTLLFGTTLAGFSAAAVLGIRGSWSRKTTWHGLMLIALSGCLIMTMAANMLTLTLGSALLDLALLAVVVSAAKGTSGASRVAWRMAVPGMLSTLVLCVGTLQLDIEVGTASLLIPEIPTAVLMLMSAAGVLRLMAFPLHPRELNTPENAALLTLPIGTGIYLLYLAQTHAPILVGQQWTLAIGGVSLLAGGLLTWAGRSESTMAVSRNQREHVHISEQDHVEESEQDGQHVPAMAGIWSGIAIHQTGFALTYGALLGTAVPWPLINLAIALGAVAIWWDSQSGETSFSTLGFFQPVKHWLEPRLAGLRASVFARFPAMGDWGESRLVGSWRVLPLAVVLVSLIGLPGTVGAQGRWRLYATLLDDGKAMLLMGALIADVFLCAGLWSLLSIALKGGRTRRLQIAPTFVMMALAALSIALGLAPTRLVGSLGLGTARANKPLGASVWGVGIIFVLPWLLGSWVARTSTGLVGGRHLRSVRNLVSLAWLFRAASWSAQRLANLVHWLGQLGEGEGWWGWALIVLVLGTMYLVNL